MRLYKPKQIQTKQRQQQIPDCGGREDETDAIASSWGGITTTQVKAKTQTTMVRARSEMDQGEGKGWRG